MTKGAFSAYFLILVCVLPVSIFADQHRGRNAAVLMMEKGAKGITYSINGRPVSKEEGLLLALSRRRDADSTKDPELTVIASEQLSFKDVTEVMGIAGKARYFRFRVLVFDKNKRVMYQLNYSQPMPFSETG